MKFLDMTEVKILEVKDSYVQFTPCHATTLSLESDMSQKVYHSQ